MVELMYQRLSVIIIDESVIAIKVIREHYADMPIIALNVFYPTKKGFRTMMGLEPKAASAILHETGAEVIGAACGLMSKSKDISEWWYPAATALLKEVRRGTDKYLAILPDAGLAQLINDKTVYPAPPEGMASEVLNWIDVGARIVGGCCGTGLEHGRRISTVLH